MSRYYKRNNGGFLQGFLIAILVIVAVVTVCTLLNHFVPQVNQFFTSINDWFINLFDNTKSETASLLLK